MNMDMNMEKSRLLLFVFVLFLMCGGFVRADILPGDANGDAVVNLDDFIILKQHYGLSSGASCAQGDFDGNGAVNLDDFIILKQYYGQSASYKSYYLDSSAGSDTNDGTKLAPWQSFSHARQQLTAGDTLYCTGSFGRVDMTASDPVGTPCAAINYRQWPNKSRPHISSLVFDGTEKDAYLLFDGFKFNPGYVSTGGLTENNAVNLDGASHITFDKCYFEGPKLAGATGDFAPYNITEQTQPPTLTPGNPGNASYITIINSQFGYSTTAIRLVEHPAYPDKQARHWRIENNDFAESAEDFITVSLASDAVISGNTMHNQSTYRSAFLWPGAATGNWPADYSFATITQDVTGSSAIFYRMTDQRIYILADDSDHLPNRSTTHVWRLDSDPQNVYFTPSGRGDSTHGDCIAVQGPSRNILIARNWMETHPGGGQALKLDDVGGQPEYITIENNIFISRTTAPTYLILLQGGSNSVFRHNVVYPGPGAPLARGVRLLEDSGSPWQNLQFYNNILSGAVVSSGTTIADYNCWMSTPPTGFGSGANDILVSGLAGVGIVDTANMDFHLLGSSAARDAGNPAYAPGVSASHPYGIDIEGADRDAIPDIGAYEFLD